MATGARMTVPWMSSFAHRHVDTVVVIRTFVALGVLQVCSHESIESGQSASSGAAKSLQSLLHAVKVGVVDSLSHSRWILCSSR